MESALYYVRAKTALSCRYCRERQAEAGNAGQAQSTSALWRPWVMTARDSENHRRSPFASDGDGSGSKQSLGFKHPVRLYLPRSKADHYLHMMGEKVLSSFPVQATMHFYNDDSDTEEELEEEEEQEDPIFSLDLESENAPETTEMFWKQ
ncbi:protein ripply3 [Amblyraja radiata]|uniref:protein ripply3 n=1 Tax=Amblyraja radiata TaxID=386614 RepID=UPI001401E8F1|nr:protein ripply3 [Amblyraja radiata]